MIRANKLKGFVRARKAQESGEGGEEYGRYSLCRLQKRRPRLEDIDLVTAGLGETTTWKGPSLGWTVRSEDY